MFHKNQPKQDRKIVNKGYARIMMLAAVAEGSFFRKFTGVASAIHSEYKRRIRFKDYHSPKAREIARMERRAEFDRRAASLNYPGWSGYEFSVI